MRIPSKIEVIAIRCMWLTQSKNFLKWSGLEDCDDPIEQFIVLGIVNYKRG